MNEQEFNNLQPGDELIGNDGYKRVVIEKSENDVAYWMYAYVKNGRSAHSENKDTALRRFTTPPKEKWVVVPLYSEVYDSLSKAKAAAIHGSMPYKTTGMQYKPVKIIEE